jgi:hypothetical protein
VADDVGAQVAWPRWRGGQGNARGKGDVDARQRQKRGDVTLAEA